MRMSDWSSDVCSSDLRRQCRAGVPAAPRRSDDPPVRARESRLAARRKSAHGGGHDARGKTFSFAGANDLARDADRPALTAHPLRPGGAAPILGAMAMAGYGTRSEEQTSELETLMRISYAVICLKKKNTMDTCEYKK